MPKYLRVTVSIPVREEQEILESHEIQGAIRLVPSPIHEAHTLLLDGDILVDSLAEVTEAIVVEE